MNAGSPPFGRAVLVAAANVAADNNGSGETKARSNTVYLAQGKYGPGTIPAGRSPEFFSIDYRRAVHEPTKNDALGIIRSQNRVFLNGTEPGGVRIMPAPGAAPIRVGDAVLFRLAREDSVTEIGRIALRDDGRGADELAGDGSFGGTVLPGDFGLADRASRLVLHVPVEQADATTDVQFLFEYTGAAPAEIEGVTVARVQDGSLAFHVAVTVRAPGLFEWLGRLVDQSGHPVALLKATGQLQLSDHDVQLVAHGLLLREQGAWQALTLRDIEGWRIRIGGALPKEVVAPWRGSFQAPSVNRDELTPDPWRATGRPTRILPRATAVPLK